MLLRSIIVAIALSSQVLAQVTVGTYSPRNKPDDFVFRVNGKDKPVKFLFQNDSEYELLSLDSAFRQGKSLVYNQVDRKNRFTVSLETENALSLYFIHVKTGRFGVLTVSDSSFKWSNLFDEQEKEHFLKAIPYKNKICVLSVNETNNNLIVRTYQHAQLASQDTFRVEYEPFFSALKANLNMLNQEPFSDIGVTYIDYEVEQDLSDIYTDRKLYVRDDKLVMTFDEHNTSHLLFFDLTKRKSYYKKFEFKLDVQMAAQNHRGNSFLFKDHFFRITSNGHQINLAIVDFRNFKLVRNLNAYDDQPIEIKNGPLLSEQSTNGSVPVVEPIKNTEKFFKKIRGVDLGVTVRELDESKLEVMLGSHYMEVYVTPAMNPTLGLGMGAAMGMGMGVGIGSAGMYDPFYYPYGMSQRSHNVSIEKAYFHSIISDQEFEHLQDPLQSSYLDKKKLFWNKAFKSSNVPDIDVEYAWKGQMHYGYWDRKLGKFVLLQFDK